MQLYFRSWSTAINLDTTNVLILEKCTSVIIQSCIFIALESPTP